MSVHHVVRPHVCTYPNPLSVRAGETVTTGRQDTEWPGWTWCTAANGLCGWIPEGYLKREGIQAILLKDYRATELSVSEGDPVKVKEVESGWAWCVSANGEEGWLPQDHLSLTQ